MFRRNDMDAQERKDDLITVKKLLENAKEILDGCGMRSRAWEINDLLTDIADDIADADREVHEEQMREEDALTKLFFHEAYWAFRKL